MAIAIEDARNRANDVSFQFLRYKGGCTKQEALNQSKIHVGVLSSTLPTRANFAIASEEKFKLNEGVPSTCMMHTRSACDLQESVAG
eukprot:20982-Pyramimonas_sp.AAC.1